MSFPSLYILNASLESTYLVPRFDETFKFIKDAKEQGGRILVHCKMGVSRSASCVIAYLMKEYKIDVDEALKMTRNERPIVDPNEGFLRQLEEYNGILNAKVGFQNPNSLKLETPQASPRKISAAIRCSEVDVKEIVGSLLSSIKD